MTKQIIQGLFIWAFFLGYPAFAQTVEVDQPSLLMAVVNLVTAILIFVFGLLFLRGIFEKLTSGGVEALNAAAYKRLLTSLVGALITFAVYWLIRFIATFF